MERGRGRLRPRARLGPYEPPASLVDAIARLRHLVALLPAEHAGPEQQTCLRLGQRLAKELIVDVEEHSATMQRHLAG
jgi:hypothetical protein